MKAKIKYHSDKVTDFYGKKFPKVDSNHICLAVISLDSVVRKDGSYYPQVFLKECKDFEKKSLLAMLLMTYYSHDDSDEE